MCGGFATNPLTRFSCKMDLKRNSFYQFNVVMTFASFCLQDVQKNKKNGGTKYQGAVKLNLSHSTKPHRQFLRFQKMSFL